MQSWTGRQRLFSHGVHIVVERDTNMCGSEQINNVSSDTC